MLKKIGKLANLSIETFMVIMILTMFVAVCLQVFFRYVLLAPLSWSEELARYCFVWLSFIGAAMALGQRLHFGIDYLVNKFPAKLRAAVELITNSLVLIFCLVLVIKGHAVLDTASRMLSAGMELRMDYVFSAIPVAGLIMIFFVLRQMWESVAIISGIKPPPEPPDACEAAPDLTQADTDNEMNSPKEGGRS